MRNTTTTALSLIAVALLLGIAKVPEAMTSMIAGPTNSPRVIRQDDDPGQTEYVSIREIAEQAFAEGSYRRALQLYERALALELDPTRRRWVAFRIADSSWRAEAGSNNADTTVLETARAELETLTREVTREEDQDLVWAEAHESLGDFWWVRRESRNWGQAWPHYQPALDWWAGSADITRARDRYIGIVWTIADPPATEPYYTYGNYGNVVPLEVLDNVLAISLSVEDRARAHYLVAMTLRQQGGSWQEQRRIAREFEAALESSPPAPTGATMPSTTTPTGWRATGV